jgi:hypothetical protein
MVSADGERGACRPQEAQDGADADVDGGAEQRRAAVVIQGRARAPGAPQRPGSVAMGSIRGRTCALGTARRGSGGSAALARHFAGLDQERAAKRARCDSYGDQDSRPTAAQRLAALRQRLAARIGDGTQATGAAAALPAAGIGVGSSHARRQQDTTRPLVEAAADFTQAGRRLGSMGHMRRPSNEDVNIHFGEDARAGGGGEAAAAGRPTPASAAAAAQQAWHAAVATTPAP